MHRLGLVKKNPQPTGVTAGQEETESSKSPKSKERQLVVYVPKSSKEDLDALRTQHHGSTNSSNSVFSMLCRSKSSSSPMDRLFSDSHETSLRLLSGLAQYCQTGSLGFQAPDYLNTALGSYQKDCKSLFKLCGSIRSSQVSRGVKTPLGLVAVNGGMAGWLGAMKDLAIYRKALTPDSLDRLMPYQEDRGRKPPMFHNFSPVLLGKSANVVIHNTKATNGEGATRVMSFVKQDKDGTWRMTPPNKQTTDAVFSKGDAPAQQALVSARKELTQLETQLDALQRNLPGYQAKVTTLRDAAKAPDLSKRDAKRLAKQLPAAEAKLRDATQTLAQLPQAIRQKERELVGLQAEVNGSIPHMLDLSYDDLYSGLEQLKLANGWGDQEMAGALLQLLEKKPSTKVLAALSKPLTIEGIKVKDVLDPRESTQTGDVQMTGQDLCQTLLSIMFLTEPKHALPMAVANGDALRAVKAGAIPLEALFAPLEIVEKDGLTHFGIGSTEENLGSLLASANNLRTVLDPADSDQRAFKEQAMPLCETKSLEMSQDTLATILRGDRLPRNQTEQAAVLFPVLKSVLMRTLVEKQKLGS